MIARIHRKGIGLMQDNISITQHHPVKGSLEEIYKFIDGRFMRYGDDDADDLAITLVGYRYSSATEEEDDA